MKLCDFNNNCGYVVVAFDITYGGSGYNSIESYLDKKGLKGSLDGKGIPRNTFIYKGNSYEINDIIKKR